MNNKVKIIALDLDGTLLTGTKELAEKDRDALERAAAAGIEIVPTTGRFFNLMPEIIRGLDFIHYAITINGAEVYDICNDTVIDSELIPLDEALEIMTYLDSMDVIYDCYMGSAGWMTRTHWEKGDEYAPDVHYRRMIHDFRTPVPDLKTFITEKGNGIQKIQYFCKDLSLRERGLAELPVRFSGLSVSSSLVNNVEINCETANKGMALVKLAEHLGYSAVNTMSFGDGLNDLSMIKAAGTSVAMANAVEEVKKYASYITLDNDSCGVAHAIDRLIFNME